MPRYFTSTDDIRCSAAGTAGADGNFSAISLIRRDVGESGIGKVTIAWHPTNGERVEFALISANVHKLWSNESADAPFSFPEDVWTILAISKATGTTNPRFHMKRLDTQAYTHGDGVDTVTGMDVSSGSSWIHGNNAAGTNPLTGDIAWAAIYAKTVSDGEFEDFASLQDILDFGPNRMWLLNQSSVTEEVQDISGNGANQTSRTGTTVSASDAPSPWNALGPSDAKIRVVRSPLRW